MIDPTLVSVHGGHSGQFCNHASDSLEKIIQTYISQGFSWVGITEHTPAISHELLYPDERKVGLTPELMLKRFGQYITECRRMQQLYSADISIYVGMEIETYSGYKNYVTELIEHFKPDYIVGSVHFVDDVPFDYSQEHYNQAVEIAGGLDTLYCRYFDLQYEMLEFFKPAVVGHFDLIRLFDREYEQRLQRPEILEKIWRNLRLIKDHDLILDYNFRAILKGAREPYVSQIILEKAAELGIAVVPGDDSHGVDSVGYSLDDAVVRLRKAGLKTDWKKPRLYTK